MRWDGRGAGAIHTLGPSQRRLRMAQAERPPPAEQFVDDDAEGVEIGLRRRPRRRRRPPPAQHLRRPPQILWERSIHYVVTGGSRPQHGVRPYPLWELFNIKELAKRNSRKSSNKEFYA